MPQNINSDPLSGLHDIIAPTAASWWPLPLIYWGILLVFIAVLSISVYFILQYKKNKKQQQKHLVALAGLQIKNANFIALNQLLKGVSIASFPRSQVASLHGNAWYDFLLAHSSFNENTLFKGRPLFISQLYEKSSRECDENDFTQAKKWIKQLPSFIKKNNKVQKATQKAEQKSASTSESSNV